VTDEINVQIVDDHPLVARGLMGLLSEAPIHLLDPVESVEDVDPQAQVVICDLILQPPGRSGANAIKYVAEDVPVIATSGYATDIAIASAVASGAFAFMSKTAAGATSSAWLQAIQASAVRAHVVSAALAKALLTDARHRPLKPGLDLDQDLIAGLKRILLDADSPMALAQRDWTSVSSRSMTDRIWTVARRRQKAYQPKIHDRLREAAPHIRAGLTIKETAKIINCGDRYLNKLLSELRAQFRDDAQLNLRATVSPLLALEPKSLLIRLIEMEEEAQYGHSLGPSALPEDLGNPGP
jgi:DNA-binding NarL/FixJ family response regulator